MNRVRDLVKRPVDTIRADTLVADALPLAEKSPTRKLVVERHGRVAGMICLCDLQKAPPRSRVDRWMSIPVETIEANAFADDAFTRMKVLDIGSLLVEDGGKTLGLLTLEDALGSEGVKCACCGSIAHVRLDPASGAWFCLDCSANAHTSERVQGMEMGGGD
ncbi:MAG TPA: CBS domain-containing protein [bacterium]|nr:CBS domain-containing protein [bacterium]